MFSATWVLTLTCLCQIQTSLGHFPDLENVAYSKTVTLSSNFHSGGYGGSKAVNGMYDDLAHTGRERYPWLRIDLGGNFFIHEVEVFARATCVKCGKQLHNFDVKFGKHKHDLRRCGHYSRETHAGQRVAFWCPGNSVGRYVLIRIAGGRPSYLSVAEVLVWGIPERLMKQYYD
ncbi:fucolectin-like [Crassostrea virginica]